MLARRRGRDREQGQIVVLFALVMVVLLAFAALVVDVGVLRNNRQILVNTMDAAALAGGTMLPIDGSAAPAGALPGSQYNLANALIDRTVQANYPGGLTLGTGYTIAYKCLIGATATGQPRLSDLPRVCDISKSLHRAAVASDFRGAGPTRIASCHPELGDLCNTVVVTGNATTRYALAPAVGVANGNTGAVQSAACNGPCGKPPQTPVDVVLIMDRTLSMTAQDIADIQTGADALLSVFNPSLQRVALGLIGPSVPGKGTCPSGSTSPLKRQGSPANQVYGIGQSPAGNVNFFSNPADLTKWIPVGFSGTDATTPAVTFNEAYSTAGTTNTNSTIWKAISCIYSYTTGTNLDTPVSMAQTYLQTYGRPGVKKAIILETDGTPQAGDGSAHYTCNASNNTATVAKAAGIEMFTIGFGIAGATCPTRSGGGNRNANETAAWAGKPVSTLLASMASPDLTPTEQHWFDAPDSATLIDAFRQAAVTITKTGPYLIQLYPTPIVASVGPSTGTHLGGTTITITGNYFGGATSVRFGGAPATFTVVSDTTITATSPAGTAGQTVGISVTTDGGTSPDTAADNFTYN